LGLNQSCGEVRMDAEDKFYEVKVKVEVTQAKKKLHKARSFTITIDRAKEEL